MGTYICVSKRTFSWLKKIKPRIKTCCEMTEEVLCLWTEGGVEQEIGK